MECIFLNGVQGLISVESMDTYVFSRPERSYEKF